jgi:hypothetical protein
VSLALKAPPAVKKLQDIRSKIILAEAPQCAIGMSQVRAIRSEDEAISPVP